MTASATHVQTCGGNYFQIFLLYLWPKVLFVLFIVYTHVCWHLTNAEIKVIKPSWNWNWKKNVSCTITWSVFTFIQLMILQCKCTCSSLQTKIIHSWILTHLLLCFLSFVYNFLFQNQVEYIYNNLFLYFNNSICS